MLRSASAYTAGTASKQQACRYTLASGTQQAPIHAFYTRTLSDTSDLFATLMWLVYKAHQGSLYTRLINETACGYSCSAASVYHAQFITGAQYIMHIAFIRQGHRACLFNTLPCTFVVWGASHTIPCMMISAPQCVNVWPSAPSVLLRGAGYCAACIAVYCKVYVFEPV